MQNLSIPQDWNVYFSRIGDAPAALRINLALIEVAPLAEYLQHVRVSMKLEQTNEHGFPTPEESEAVYDIEDQIDRLAGNDNIPAGIVTTDGAANWHFYSRDAEAFAQACRTLLTQNNRVCDIKISEDAEWSFYQEFLYPDRYELQAIRNEQVLRRFRQDGDRLEQPRPIDYWLFFHTEADLNAAAAKVAALGYTVSDSGRIEHEEDHPSYRLQLSKNAPLTDIDNDTWELIDIAHENNGDYDGWGSILVQ
ncbi:TPA: DUF695 domain-containing protein [Neisseria subflava]|jgi:hypothetical protein